MFSIKDEMLSNRAKTLKMLETSQQVTRWTEIV